MKSYRETIAERLHNHPDYPRPCVAMYALLAEAAGAFPQAGTDEEINGADAVDWLVPWVLRVRDRLNTAAPVPEAPAVPISRPGSTLEDLHNDLANLECALRLAGWARDVEHQEQDEPNPSVRMAAESIVDRLLNDGAGSYEAGALVSWLGQKLEETRNTIDALEGAGPPLEDAPKPCDQCDGTMSEHDSQCPNKLSNRG